MNDVAYTPFPMRVLGRLAEVCQKIKKRIDLEVRELDRQSPAAIKAPKCHGGTAVGKLIARLSESTKNRDIHRLATLSESETARLDSLRADLGKDPAKAARLVGRLKDRLEAVNVAFETLQKAVEDVQVVRLTRLYREYQTARAVATTAARDLFAKEPLRQIGSDAWRMLWETARSYSEQHAYSAASVSQHEDRRPLCSMPAGAGLRRGGSTHAV